MQLCHSLIPTCTRNNAVPVNHKLCLVYSKLNKNEHVCDMVVYSIHVYSTLFSLQQIVVTYKLQV